MHKRCRISSCRYGITQSKEFAQRWINLFFIGDGNSAKLFISDLIVSTHQCTGRTIMSFTDFTVPKDVTEFHKSVDQLHATVIIPWQVIAIGEMEGVDIPVIGIIS